MIRKEGRNVNTRLWLYELVGWSCHGNPKMLKIRVNVNTVYQVSVEITSD